MLFNWGVISFISAVNCFIFMVACVFFQDILNNVELGYIFFYTALFFAGILALVVSLKILYELNKNRKAVK